MLADKYHSVVMVIGTVFLLQACESMTMPSLSSFPDLSALSAPTSFFKRDSTAENESADQQPQEKVDFSQPPLTCLAHGGSANFGQDWYDFSPVSFDIRRYQRQNVTIPRRWGRDEMQIEVHFADNGQKLTFCAAEEPEEGDILCASLYALENDFALGIKRTLDVPDAIRGGTIECKYHAQLRF